MNAHLFRDGRRAGAWALPLSQWLQPGRRRKAHRLDVETLSDHMRRDLGLIGGRDAPPRDLLRD